MIYISNSLETIQMSTNNFLFEYNRHDNVVLLESSFQNQLDPSWNFTTVISS